MKWRMLSKFTKEKIQLTMKQKNLIAQQKIQIFEFMIMGIDTDWQTATLDASGINFRNYFNL